MSKYTDQVLAIANSASFNAWLNREQDDIAPEQDTES